MTEAHYHQSAIEKAAHAAVWKPRLEALRKREREIMLKKDQWDMLKFVTRTNPVWFSDDYQELCEQVEKDIAYLESLPDYEPFVVADTPDRQPSPGCALAIVAAVLAFTIVVSLLLFRIFP